MKIWDIASIILGLSGLPIPSYFDGYPPPSILKDIKIKIYEKDSIDYKKKKIKKTLRKIKFHLSEKKPNK